MRRADPARAAAVGIASAAALLVGGGLALDLAGALDTTGWAVLVAVLALGLMIAARARAPRALPVLVAVAALALAAGSVAFSRASARDHDRETTFTQLWIVLAGTGRSAEVGVRNEERDRAEFRVEVYAPPSQGGPPLVAETFVLERGRTWSRRLAIPGTPLPERVNVELFRGRETEPYRSAHVWTSP